MIDCKKIAQDIKDDCKKRLAKIENKDYYLKIIQVEGDEASNAYTKGKKKDCEEIGLKCKHVLLPNKSKWYHVDGSIVESGIDDNCIGIILQLPLPTYLKEHESYLLQQIPKHKDVDGFKEDSPFQPCTPKAIMHIIHKEYGSVDGKVVTVVGRGKLVGRPLIKMLDKENATVICCNSHTTKENLEKILNNSDVVITATGQPNTILKDMVTNKNIVIIDTGITKDENGKLCGDCDKELYNYMDKITSVPKGVGLVTRAMLMQNCVEAIENIEKEK